MRWGIAPHKFWSSTLAEVTLQLRSFEDEDKRHWQRAAHQLSMMYNVNRGRAQALSWEDFYPYSKEHHFAPATVMTEGLEKDFAYMAKMMTQNG